VISFLLDTLELLRQVRAPGSGVIMVCLPIPIEIDCYLRNQVPRLSLVQGGSRQRLDYCRYAAISSGFSRKRPDVSPSR
jgi:hypothetical protein